MRLDDIEMSEEIAIAVIKRFMDNPYFDNVLRKALSLSLDALAERVNKSDRGIRTEKLIEVSVTNGDMIKALFPYIEPKFYTNLSGIHTVDIKLNDKVYGDVYNTHTFSTDWWNAPYNAESE